MKPKQFIFERVDFDREKGLISMHYSFDGKTHFTESLLLESTNYEEVDEKLLERALFNLHLIGGISYYKAFCPEEIIVKSGVLNREEAAFWDKLYTQGLGEFFYQNKIDFRGLIEFPYGELGGQAIAHKAGSKVLLPFGGGKDSLVSAELLKKGGIEFDLFHMGQHEGVSMLAEKVGEPLIGMKRNLSPELFRLNAEGAYNGHVPISAYIAFVTVLLGLLYGYKDIVLSNEHSANYGNVSFHGIEVNHQYSKSLEFEQDLKGYLEKFVTPDIRYFSLLRPYHELRIAELFSTEDQYFENFSSCNRNFKILGEGGQMTWCGECPKCAFVFAILAPYIPKDKLTAFFGKNLFADTALWPLFEELLGLSTVKPFECVGTPQEVQLAFELVTESGDYNEDQNLMNFKDKGLSPLSNSARKELLELSSEHLVPTEYFKLLS